MPIPPLRFRLLISSSDCFFALTVIILLTSSCRYLSSLLIRERRLFKIDIRSIAAVVASSYRGLDQLKELNSNSFVISSNYMLSNSYHGAVQRTQFLSIHLLCSQVGLYNQSSSIWRVISPLSNDSESPY